jgi:hypothetical protein
MDCVKFYPIRHLRSTGVLDELRASSSVSSGINCQLLGYNTLVSNNSRDLDRSCVLSGSHERILESTNETKHNQKLFCRSCYGKKFGPKGYGYGGGRAGVLSMDDGTGSSLHVTPRHFCRCDQICRT